jgi:anti-anti-sigma factor
MTNHPNQLDLRNQFGSADSVHNTFECNVTYRSDEARVAVRGDLGLQTVPAVRRTVLRAAALPIGRVTVDLGEVDSMDRYAVNVLVALRDQVRERSTRFVLAAPSRSVRRALAAAGVLDRFECESIWWEYPANEFSA